ncbi:type B DNA-directed DNA polymerase [Caldiplasma sukawensis]
MEQIINARGTDEITLWIFDGKNIRKRKKKYRTWIFVTGDTYDLEFLGRQLDESSFEFQWEKMNDIYGEKIGIKIHGSPSFLKKTSNAVEFIGENRKFRIYNADVDPVLRYMCENDLTFFNNESLLDDDYHYPSVYISGKSINGIPQTIRINDSDHMKIDYDSIMQILDEIDRNIFIFYNNRNNFFRNLVKIAETIFHMDIARTLNRGESYRSYGRVYSRNGKVFIKDRIAIDMDSFVLRESGISGLIETSRVSFLPPEKIASITSGSAVSALEEAYAIRHGILIPWHKDDHEMEKTAQFLSLWDAGGSVLEPEPGIYSDVYEIDFSSMYPSIIVNYNISPETLEISDHITENGTMYKINRKKRGFLSAALETLLERRLLYKSMRAISEVYMMRDKALKWMLLTSFGYTGYKNAKFGRIEAHEAITGIGREILRKTMKLALKFGFETIHGIVDSLWLKGSGDIDSLLKAIKNETGIDIVVDGKYFWICFFRSKNGTGALNRYAGLSYDGKIKVRGIELRRHDSPPIVKKFQSDAFAILSECRTVDEIWNKRNRIEELKRYYMKKLNSLPVDDYKINFRISRHPEEYAVNNIQKTFGNRIRELHMDIQPGDVQGGVVIDKKNRIVDLPENAHKIDTVYYRNLLLRAFEPVDQIVEFSSPYKNKKMTLYDFT